MLSLGERDRRNVEVFARIELFVLVRAEQQAVHSFRDGNDDREAERGITAKLRLKWHRMSAYR